MRSCLAICATLAPFLALGCRDASGPQRNPAPPNQAGKADAKTGESAIADKKEPAEKNDSSKSFSSAELLIGWRLAAICTAELQGAVQTKVIEYRHGDTVLEGYLAWDGAVTGLRPGVLVVHDWTGLGDFARLRTNQLAELGYVAFALDMYGQGIRPKTPQESAAQAGIHKQDRKLMRARAQAGLEVLLRTGQCDPKRVAAIGYCFGGTTVLELARSGAEIAGVVSFHGGLDTPTPGDAKHIRCKVLVLHGADDPHVPHRDVDAFEEEMRAGGVDWQLIAYGGAVHSFTNPAAGNDKAEGAAYNASADRRSWEAMKLFFGEIFK